jgi:hypothetical protein
MVRQRMLRDRSGCHCRQQNNADGKAAELVADHLSRSNIVDALRTLLVITILHGWKSKQVKNLCMAA